jgi:hypothetical protein
MVGFLGLISIGLQPTSDFPTICEADLQSAPNISALIDLFARSHCGGTLTPIPGATLAINPAGSSNIDIAVSADGKFLYSLNAGTGAVGMFAIQPTSGALTDLGTAGSLPAAAGLNGIAAN